jgi:hypothetical protein
VVHGPCTTLSELWNFSGSSFPFSLIYTALFVNASIVCVVISSFINVVLFASACSLLVFSFSNCTIICAAFSLRGSNSTFLSCFYICISFNSICRVFISQVPSKRLVMLIVFYRCLSSCMEVLNFPSPWSHYWTFFSSSRIVHIYDVLSNNSSISLTSFSILVIWSADCCSLCSWTSGGVIGLRISLSSSISFLYL